MKVVLVTGGFDPLHSGHMEYFNAARALGGKLIVGGNSDAWLKRKKGKAFMPITERTSIIQNLKMVDHCILFNDDDDTAIEAIKNVTRDGIIAFVSFVLSAGVSYLAGVTQTDVVLSATAVLTALLKGLDSYQHKSGGTVKMPF